MKWLITATLIGLANSKLPAQDQPRSEFNPATLVDEIFAVQDLDVNYQDLYENFLQLLSNPINLNSATEEQLSSLYLLSQGQIKSILKHRQQTGPFISMLELQTILDHETFSKIVPFLIVTDASQSVNKSIIKRITTEQNNYLLLRWSKTMEHQLGYSEKATPSNRFMGSQDNLYARFRTSRPGDFSLGFTMKKEPGETIAWRPERKYYCVDYVSFHVQTLNKGKIKNIILGDYQAQFGQGISLGSAFGIGKNGEPVITMRRANVGFLPYTSTYEAGFFRGLALSCSLGQGLTLHSMISLRGRDGTLRQDTISPIPDYVSTLGYTGFHRTAKEIENRNAVTESNLASVIQFKGKLFDTGVILHHTQFSEPLLHTPLAYNQFEFNGNANTNAGGYANLNFSNYALFSEFSQTIGHGQSIVGGVLTGVTSKLDVSLAYRKFDKDFYSFYSNAVSENSTPQNETGIYWGWKYSFNKKYSIAGYFDSFSFPWLKYRSYSPSDGTEWLIRLNYRPTKKVTMFLQVREESKQRNSAIRNNLYLHDNGVKKNYWVNCDYAGNEQLRFQSRVQFTSYSITKGTTHGMALIQDIEYSIGRLSIKGRYALFDTDDYDNRIYVYESDAWLNFSVPAYYGKGVRNYLLLHYRLTNKIDLWARWAHTRYTDRNTIGSGGEAINGDTKNDVKLQARIKL